MAWNRKISGVYQIKNNINGNRYIGSSIDIHRRFYSHRYKLRIQKHVNNYLQNAWNKYGEENFTFDVLLLCPHDQVLLYEQAYLDKTKHQYNIANVAEAPMLGLHHSEETKKIISEKSKKYSGHKLTDETKQKIRMSRLGTHLTDEHKANIGKSIKERMNDEWKKKISIAQKGHTVSEETRNKISIANTGKKRSKELRKRISESSKGRIISIETRKKISEALIGRKSPTYGKKMSDDQKKKISKSNKGRTVSIETRKKISEGNKGKIVSEETRKKISDGVKKYYMDLKKSKGVQI